MHPVSSQQESRRPEPIPQSVFRSDAHPIEERFAVWSESISPIFRPILADHAKPEAFNGETHAFMLGNTVLASTSLGGVGGFEGKGSGPFHDRSELFLAQLYLSGGFHGHNAAQSLVVAAGDIVLLDSTRPLTTRVTDSEVLSLVIPRQVLMAAANTKGDVLPTVISGRSPSGLILANAFKSAWQALPDATTEDSGAVDGLLLGAIAGLVSKPNRETAGATAVERATFDAMRAYIERHLADLDLGPELLCRRFGCSRSTLYRLFATVDGVASYIRRARLERCYAELLAPPSNTTVTEVALRWGFGNFSNFCRLFRNTFGTTPGEILEKGRAKRTERSGNPILPAHSRHRIPEYRQWIEQL